MKKIVKVCTVVMVLLFSAILATSCMGGLLSALETPKPTLDIEESSLPSFDAEDFATATPTATPNVTSDYMPGILSETSYDSEYLGISFRIPEGSDFIMAAKEELDALVAPEMEAQGVDMEEMGDFYTYEMMAAAPDGLPNVILSTEQLRMKNITPEQYLKVVCEGLETGGYTIGEQERVNMLGLEFIKQPVITTQQGVTLAQDYYVTKLDDRIVSIAMTYSEDTAEQAAALLAGFVPYSAS